MGFINDGGHIVIEPQFDTLDFIWFNFQVNDWLKDKAAAVLVKSGKEFTITMFGRTFTPSDMTVYPMYLPAKRSSRWFRGLVKKYNKSHEEALPKVTTLHTLRHTFCTNLANAGVDPKALQYVMGHSNINMTLNYYAHATSDSAMSKMERLIA